MSEQYKDRELEPQKRAQALLEELSLEEKIAQVGGLFLWGEHYTDETLMERRTPYGIGEVSMMELRSAKTLEEAAGWQRKAQEIVMKNSPHGIPAIFHMEGLCGAMFQEGTSFPSGIARGSGWDPSLEEKIAQVVSRQEAACGVTHILAPVLDISRDSRMGRQGETYGEDPTLAAALGCAYVKGIQAMQTAGRQPESVAKHFLAFHNSQGGIHGTHSDTPERLLQEVYGKPFQAAITEAELKGIMPCYCSINGEPVSASHYFLTDLLREDMGFQGICVSDYGGVGNSHTVQHIGETLGETGLRCMEAGMDVELPEPAGFAEELAEMFEEGRADIHILDRAVLRVLTAKFRMGLFEHPYALEGKALEELFGRKEDRELSLQSARESMVLLKNNGALPLPEKVKKIALIGPHGDSARKFFGGYTHMCMMESTLAVANSIAGVSGILQAKPEEIKTVPGTNIQSDEGSEFDEILKRQKPDCKSLLEELRERLPKTEIIYAYGYPIAGEDENGFEEALKAVAEADVALLTLGGKHGTCSMASMGEGVDGSNINLPPCQDAFIREAAGYGKPLIGIHFNGRPISSDVADRYLDAILEAWNPSETGAQAVADVLLGDYNPGGKLPVTVAYHAGQIPIYYNHPYGSAWHQGESIGFKDYVDLPHRPRYYFGQGLSYTTFLYENLKLSKKAVDPFESLEISVEISNTGDRRGDEVVQLYLKDEYASMTRPVKELAGFCRVTLEPGEKKSIHFTISASQIAFLDQNMKWRIEKGCVFVEIGSSSEDIRCEDAFYIKETAWITGRDREFYAECKVEDKFS